MWSCAGSQALAQNQPVWALFVRACSFSNPFQYFCKVKEIAPVQWNSCHFPHEIIQFPPTVGSTNKMKPHRTNQIPCKHINAWKRSFPQSPQTVLTHRRCIAPIPVWANHFYSCAYPEASNLTPKLIPINNLISNLKLTILLEWNTVCKNNAYFSCPVSVQSIYKVKLHT